MPCSVVILVKQTILIQKLKYQNVEKNVQLTDQFIKLSKKEYQTSLFRRPNGFPVAP